MPIYMENSEAASLIRILDIIERRIENGEYERAKEGLRMIKDTILKAM